MKNNKLFRLANVYELGSTFDNINSDIRIEIFEDIDSNYRMIKVWAKRSYDVYPTFTNINKFKNDKVYSSDLLSVEITNFITDDISLLKGKQISEKQILQEAINGIHKLAKKME